MDISAENFKNMFSYKLFKSFYYQGLGWLENIGFIGSNFYCALKYIFTFNVNKKSFLEQSSRFGVDSLPLTLSIVGISGMIIALQIASEMVKQGAGDYVGSLVTLTIIREIGPIMGSFAVISMVGSSMAAEVATMKVTEQVDAMKVLGVDPICYLVVPRILAGFFVMPFVIVLANVMGIAGGLFSSTLITDLSSLSYLESVWRGLSVHDLFVSMLKACIFGGVIALVSTSMGYKTKGGALEVGKATTDAVVWSFVAIVVIDYLITLIFFD